MIFQSFSEFTAKELFAALFIRVTDFAENPLEKFQFLHEVTGRENRAGRRFLARFRRQGLPAAWGKLGES